MQPRCAMRFSEVAKGSVSARPGPTLEGTLGSRMGPGRAGMAPTSGPGWVRNTVKQSTWRIWTGPPRPGMGPGRAQDRTQARVWMAPPRDSNRLLGLSEIRIAHPKSQADAKSFFSLPCKPIPPKFSGAADSPLKFRGWSVRNPLLYSVFLRFRPLNLGGEMSPPKFRGYGLTG